MTFNPPPSCCVGGLRSDFTGQSIVLKRAASIWYRILLHWLEQAALRHAFTNPGFAATSGCVHMVDVTQSLTDTQGELDELEREEFFRLKKVQNKKKRDDGARVKAAMDKARISSLTGSASRHVARQRVGQCIALCRVRLTPYPYWQRDYESRVCIDRHNLATAQSCLMPTPFPLWPCRSAVQLSRPLPRAHGTQPRHARVPRPLPRAHGTQPRHARVPRSAVSCLFCFEQAYGRGSVYRRNVDGWGWPRRRMRRMRS